MLRDTAAFGPWQRCHFVLTSLAWLWRVSTRWSDFSDRERTGPVSGQAANPQAKNVCGFEPGHGPGVVADSSIVSQWGLVCENKYKVGLVQAMFFLWLHDRIFTNYLTYLLLRVLTASALEALAFAPSFSPLNP
ncbi:hypothetical protein LWI28_028152 [Acer negundo]|uniref:Uncharacterized protein n=1 Tax=Acer negundo TaxID=4023 RepID=A0AAD5J8E8_ACENE|nr:hypothetical protein LWI28_028152 [Acer negundo]